MKRWSSYVSVLVLLALVSSTSGATAQSPGPQNVAAPRLWRAQALRIRASWSREATRSQPTATWPSGCTTMLPAARRWAVPSPPPCR